MTRAVLQSVAVAGLCALLLALTWLATRERIAANRSAAERAQLAALTGAEVPTAPQWRDGIWATGDGRQVVRVRVNGYGGPMTLLVAMAANAPAKAPRLLGVRVTRHQETPGIADFLSRPRSGWLAELRDLPAPAVSDIDGVSGATITSRAVLRAVAEAFDRADAGAADG